LAEGTSGRVVQLLRQQGPLTIDELSAALELTRTAVRSHLTVLIGKRLVVPAGSKKGPSKPSRLYAVTPEAEQQLSRAYVPVLTQLLKRLSERMGTDEFDELMREVGAGLGRFFPATGTRRERVESGNQLLHELGALTLVVEEADRFIIAGQGCPLSAVTSEFPQACAILANLLGQITGEPVTVCCERYNRRRCCFEIPAA
jgi:predicted ArsR family transcriptional regulator